MRRRAQRDREEHLKYANESLIRDLVPVLDNLDRALAAGRGTAGGRHRRRRRRADPARAAPRAREERPHALLGGRSALRPTRHEAIARVVSVEQPPNTVVAETAPGYMLHGRAACARPWSPWPPRRTRTPRRWRATTTRRSASRGAPARPRSRRRSARSRCSTTLIATRATSRPRIASRRSARPTRSCPIPTSARTTTASARSSPAPVPDSRATSARSSTTSSRASASPAAGAPGPRTALRRRGSRLRDGDHARGGRRRRRDQDPAAQARGVRAVQRIPRRARQPAGHVRHVPRARARWRSRLGPITVARPCPKCGGEGQIISSPCRGLPGPGPHARPSISCRSAFPPASTTA